MSLSEVDDLSKSEGGTPTTFYKRLLDEMATMQAFRKKAKADKANDTCREFRLATRTYFKFMHTRQKEIVYLVDNESITGAWDRLNTMVHAACR